MKRQLFFLALLLLSFTACQQSDDGETIENELRPAKGGRHYGGVFRLNESEYIKNLFPHSIIDVDSFRVATQVYEGLFKSDQKDLT